MHDLYELYKSNYMNQQNNSRQILPSVTVGDTVQCICLEKSDELLVGVIFFIDQDNKKIHIWATKGQCKEPKEVVLSETDISALKILSPDDILNLQQDMQHSGSVLIIDGEELNKESLKYLSKLPWDHVIDISESENVWKIFSDAKIRMYSSNLRYIRRNSAVICEQYFQYIKQCNYSIDFFVTDLNYLSLARQLASTLNNKASRVRHLLMDIEKLQLKTDKEIEDEILEMLEKRQALEKEITQTWKNSESIEHWTSTVEWEKLRTWFFLYVDPNKSTPNDIFRFCHMQELPFFREYVCKRELPLCKIRSDAVKLGLLCGVLKTVIANALEKEGFFSLNFVQSQHNNVKIECVTKPKDGDYIFSTIIKVYKFKLLIPDLNEVVREVKWTML